MKKNKLMLPSKRLVGVGIVKLLLIVAGAIVIGNQVATNNDRARFEEAKRDKTQVINYLILYLGDNVVSSREQDECFNTEQGPYDNGRLWCQVTQVVELREPLSFDDVGSKYTQAANSASLKVEKSGSGAIARYWFRSTGGISCNLSMLTSDQKEYGTATSDPFTQNKSPAIAVACADRARAAYYPFVD